MTERWDLDPSQPINPIRLKIVLEASFPDQGTWNVSFEYSKVFGQLVHFENTGTDLRWQFSNSQCTFRYMLENISKDVLSWVEHHPKKRVIACVVHGYDDQDKCPECRDYWMQEAHERIANP